MSSTVDNRVVQMNFDNKQFESGVKTTVDSLSGLKKSLNLEGAVKGLSNLSNIGKTFSLAQMASNIENVSSKFSALGAIGFTILQNLTNHAMEFGRRIFASFTSPIKQGLSEYETQINAIQTIMANTASKGTTLDQVNSALDQLNEYSDKTIYNFTEMAKNIGTFTAAGVDLETSIGAIKGIANLAAVSGSNSQQAATAMYQLSQALSTGTVRLMDWNSVVNAGMGGEVFQNALKETARVSGIAIDDIIEKNGSFRESLQEGWLTSEILTKTLAKFTGDLNAEQLRAMGYTEEQIAGIIKLGQTANDAATKIKTLSQLKGTLQESIVSGWAQSWRIIFGDFEEAKGLFTEISDTLGPIIQQSSDARNAVLQAWKDWGGRTMLVDALRNAFQGVISIMKPIGEAFREIFPPRTLETLKSITLAISNFARGLKISGETASKIKRIFLGLFAGIDLIKDVIVTLVGAFFDLGGAIAPSSSSVLEFLARIGDYIVKFRQGVDVTKTFSNILLKVKNVFDIVKNAIINFGKIIKTQFSDTISNIDTSGMGSFVDKIKLRFAPFTALFKGLGFILRGFVNLVKQAAPLFFKIATAVGNFMANIGKSIVEGLGNVDFSKVFDMINAGLFAAILLGIKKFLDSGSGFINEASGVFGNIAGILDGVRGSLEAWQQNLKAKTLMTIAGAIGILTISLLILSTIDSKKLTMSLGAVTAMLLQLMGAMGIFSKISSGLSGIGASTALVALSISILIMASALSKLAKLDKDQVEQGLGAIYALSFGMVVLSKVMSKNTPSILKGSIGLIAFSIALLIMIGSVEKLGALDPAQLTNGLIGVGIMLAEIAAFMRLVDLDKMGVTKGTGLLLLAGSIIVMALAVEKFAIMDPAKIQQGLIALGLVLTELAIFTRITNNGAGILLTAVGMTILSGAMIVFTEVIGRLGDMSWEKLGKGLAGMAASLLIVIAAVRLFPNNMILTGIGLMAVATGLVILSEALSRMGNMTWDEIGKGLTALAGSLLILTVALYAMSGTLAGSAALLIAAGALAILAPVLSTLGSMALNEIGMALLGLAGVFLVLGIAGYALTPVIPTLLGLGASMMLIGVAAMLVGAGLLAFSLGLSAIAVSGAAAAVAIVAMISTILGIIPVIIKTLIDTIIIFGEGIIAATPVVKGAILALLMAVLDIIIEVTPKLLKALEILLKGLIKLIVDTVPDFVAAVLLLVSTLLKELAAKIPDFVQAGFDILLGIMRGIRDNIAEVVTVALEIVAKFIDGVAEGIPDVIASGFNLIVKFINGLADAVEKRSGDINNAVGRLAAAVIKGFTDGILGGLGNVVAAIGRLAGAAVDALKLLLGIASPSTVFKKLAGYIPLGIVAGILKYAYRVTNTTKELGNRAVNGMSEAISRINEFLIGNIDMNPTIRPVVDLSDIISGGKKLDSIMSNKTFSVIPVMSRVMDISNGLRPQFDSEGRIINTGSTISLVQNNYSPKELSRIEIYRQTKNQLLTLKGLVKA